MEISVTIYLILLLTTKVLGLASISDSTLETYYFVTSESFSDGGNGNYDEVESSPILDGSTGFGVTVTITIPREVFETAHMTGKNILCWESAQKMGENKTNITSLGEEDKETAKKINNTNIYFETAKIVNTTNTASIEAITSTTSTTTATTTTTTTTTTKVTTTNSTQIKTTTTTAAAITTTTTTKQQQQQQQQQQQ